jgi:hypothetical protein
MNELGMIVRIDDIDSVLRTGLERSRIIFLLHRRHRDLWFSFPFAALFAERSGATLYRRNMGFPKINNDWLKIHEHQVLIGSKLYTSCD